MRKLISPVLATALVPALVALPTVTAPRPAARPVPPSIVSLPLAGVEPAALGDASATVAERRAAGLDPGDATSSRPAVLTGERTVAAFDLAGVTWRAGEETPAVWVRIREDGRWSGWQRLGVTDEGPDAGTAEAARAAGRVGTGPLLADDADGVQVRVDTRSGRPPADLRLSLVDPGESPADENLDPAPPAASAAAAVAQPKIITRAQWGADESLRDGTVSLNSTVKAIVIHHTASANGYTSDSAASQLRSIYAYHTKTLGYSDIAYNFLVDKFGRIYEGRKGSITAAVRGAHAGGFNVDTMGVSALGNYDVTAAPSVMVDALARVTAWKLSQYGANPLGTVTLTSAGGGTSRYEKGTVVTKDVISPHLAFGRTACPGRYLDAKMSTLRSTAAAIVKAASTTTTVTPPPTATTAPAVPPALVSPKVSAVRVAYGNTSGVTVTAGVATRQDWRLTATSMCRSTPARTLTGTTSTGISARWDLRTGAGAPVEPGIYRLELTSTAGGKTVGPWRTDVEVTPAPGAPASPCATYRVSGADRYATSVAEGRAAFPTGDTVVVATGATERLSDGLVAAPLARAVKGPLLLVSPTGLPAPVAAEITRRKARTAYIVGSTTAVGSAVENQLRELGVVTVTRLAGRDRYATAAAVASVIGAREKRAVIASGVSLVDAAAVSGAAARTGRPILLVNPRTAPGPTRVAVRSLGVTRLDVVGSTTVVPAAVVSELGVKDVGRYAGSDRYATAAAVARGLGPAVGTDTVMVASGATTNLVDSIAGGALGQVTVLAAPGRLPDVSAAVLRPAQRAVVVGSPAAVSTATMRAVHVALNS